MDPAVGEHVRVGQPEPFAEHRPETTEHVGRGLRRVGDDEDEVTRARAGLDHDPIEPVLTDELGDRGARPVGLDRDVDQPLRAEPSGGIDELVDLAPRGTGEARSDDRLDPSTRREGSVEDREPGRRIAGAGGERRADVLELHAEPQIGLVGAVALDHLVEGEARERDLEQRPLGGGGP